MPPIVYENKKSKQRKKHSRRTPRDADMMNQIEFYLKDEDSSWLVRITAVTFCCVLLSGVIGPGSRAARPGGYDHTGHGARLQGPRAWGFQADE